MAQVAYTTEVYHKMRESPNTEPFKSLHGLVFPRLKDVPSQTPSESNSNSEIATTPTQSSAKLTGKPPIGERFESSAFAQQKHKLLLSIPETVFAKTDYLQAPALNIMPPKKGTKNKGRKAKKQPPPPRPASPKPFRPNQAPVRTTEDGEELWELNEVVASKLMYGKLYYQVSWKGWSKDEFWYPASDLKRSPHLLVEFHFENPEAAGPPRRIEIWDKAYDEDTEEGLEKHEEDDLPMTVAEKKTWMDGLDLDLE